MAKLHLSAAVVAFAVVLVACDDQTPGPNTPNGSTLRETGTQGDRPRTMDDEFERVARQEVPGFAGVWPDSGGLTVFVTDLGQRGTAEAYVARLRASGQRPGNTSVRLVRYDWPTLRTWERAIEPLLRSDDVYWIDMDERLNRLRVGVRDPAAVARVQELGESLGIPPEALTPEVRGRPAPRSHTLQDRTEVLDGGFQIDNADDALCTLGFNTYRADGSPSFWTAAHCSVGGIGPPDGGNIYQPLNDFPVQDNLIGYEVRDRNFYPCFGSPPPPGMTCRWSDAAEFAYDFDVQIGYIARTMYPAFGTPGSIEINHGNPRFEITSTDENLSCCFNYDVNKIGQTTGWTDGTITQTCVTWFDAGGLGKDLICMHVTNLHSNEGDSGAPIFRITDGFFPSGIQIRGLLWGGPATNLNETWYSTLVGMRNDFFAQDPSQQFWACSGYGGSCAGQFGPAPAFPPELTVSINGPSEVPPDRECTWTAQVAGGNGGYTYQWSGMLSGTSSWVTGYGSNGTSLILHVTSSDGQEVGNSIYVTTSPDAEVCEAR